MWAPISKHKNKKPNFEATEWKNGTLARFWIKKENSITRLKLETIVEVEILTVASAFLSYFIHL